MKLVTIICTVTLAMLLATTASARIEISDLTVIEGITQDSVLVGNITAAIANQLDEMNQITETDALTNEDNHKAVTAGWRQE